MEKKWERDNGRPSVPPKPQNRYIQRWKTSVILVPRVEHCPIRWEIVSATSNLADGKVMAIVSGGRDYEVTVDFDKAGTKKMFASFAKLKKV